MSTLPTLLAPLALSLPATLSGMIFTISYVAWPALTLAPTALFLRQYVRIYAIGAATAPPIALAGAVSASILAYLSSQDGNREKAGLWIAAAVATMGIVPFTLVLMKGVNGGLHARELEVRGKGNGVGALGKEFEGEWEVETRRLAGSWGRLNAVRGVFPLVGCGVGWLAYLS